MLEQKVIALLYAVFMTSIIRKQILNALYTTAGYVNKQYLKSRLEGPHLQQLLLDSTFHPRVHHVSTSEENILNKQVLNVL